MAAMSTECALMHCYARETAIVGVWLTIRSLAAARVRVGRLISSDTGTGDGGIEESTILYTVCVSGVKFLPHQVVGRVVAYGACNG